VVSIPVTNHRDYHSKFIEEGDFVEDLKGRVWRMRFRMPDNEAFFEFISGNPTEPNSFLKCHKLRKKARPRIIVEEKTVEFRAFGTGNAPFYEPRSKPHLLYVISPTKMWPCKIGISRDPKQRLIGLQTSHWEILELIAAFKCEQASQAEISVHQELKKYRIRNEWFDRRTRSNRIDFQVSQ
jgi:hypothetical protein